LSSNAAADPFDLSVIRPEIKALEWSGIGKVAVGALHEKDVIPLWFGESDLTSPDFVNAAAKKALDAGQTFYNYSRGHLPLREALQRYYKRLYGVDLDPDRITVPGSTMLTVLIAGQCMVRTGDEVIIIGPHWPNVATVVTMLGAKPVFVRLVEGQNGWNRDLDRVGKAVTVRTRAVYVNSPSNPTGWIMTPGESRALMEICRKQGLGLISDEVYHRNVFDGPDPAPSMIHVAEPREPVFILNGFSKAWAMTGWRLGWMITPSGMAEPMSVLAECNNTGATAFTQYGGIAALDHGESFLADFVERCRHNRALVMEILGRHPKIRLSKPQGAFYAFPKVEGMTDSLAFCRRVLEEGRVGIAPGYTFGPGNDGHFRLCFARRSDELEEALVRIVRVLDRMN
jgi:aspartate/methionine/tyrosine aminotransferase